MADWREIAAIGGTVVAIALPVAKFVHNALTRSILEEISKLRRDVIYMQREQKQNDIEARYIARTQDALTNLIIESLVSKEQARKLIETKVDISREKDWKLEQAESEFQKKIEELDGTGEKK